MEPNQISKRVQMEPNQISKRVRLAKQISFRNVFEPIYFARGNILPTLGDDDIAILFVVSKKRTTKPEEIMSLLPERCRDHFEMVQKMRTVRGMFFDKFSLFAKSEDDGVLIGFGADEMYYVLAVWDKEDQSLWQPEQDLYERHVIDN